MDVLPDHVIEELKEEIFKFVGDYEAVLDRVQSEARAMARDKYDVDLTRSSTLMSQQASKILEPDIGDETKPLNKPSVQAVKG